MSIDPAELAIFVRKSLSQNANRFVLRHMQLDGRGYSAAVLLSSYEAPELDDVITFAREVIQHSLDDAADTGGAQSYSLLAQLDGAELGQRRWRVTGDRLLEEGGGPTEPANATGALALTMRHSEKLMQTIDSMAGRCFKLLGKQIERLEKQNSHYAEAHVKVIQKFEELSIQDHERKLEVAKLESSMVLRGKAIAQIEPVVPALLARFLGKPLVPDDPDAVNALDAFLTSIEPDQAGKLMEQLTPGQQASLQMIYEARAKAKRAAEEKRAGASGGA